MMSTFQVLASQRHQIVKYHQLGLWNIREESYSHFMSLIKEVKHLVPVSLQFQEIKFIGTQINFLAMRAHPISRHLYRYSPRPYSLPQARE